ncbi:hypothetical protein JJQ72_08525 [Paenibacillus sp. F411]|uniref:hypothetical protein n=1 Tax=Paenibacillus sp. F411 TaxID=2820239 RepID=UPI001AAF4B06|nr:hypothetical protein [Paenibacillus sp. F411]MBO2944008.1 hypothetical protein [Paenibacillus sp. F411]
MDKPLLQKLTLALPLLLAAGTWLPGAVERASANFFTDAYHNIQQFTDLPGEIDELKSSYQQSLEELDQVRADAELYRQQNEALAEQNRQLSLMVQQLQQAEDSRQRAEEARQQSAARIRTTAYTAAGLLAGYFILTRALRYGMRRTNRRA